MTLAMDHFLNARRRRQGSPTSSRLAPTSGTRLPTIGAKRTNSGHDALWLHARTTGRSLRVSTASGLRILDPVRVLRQPVGIKDLIQAVGALGRQPIRRHPIHLEPDRSRVARIGVDVC
jgi:hypothetical protein